MVSVSVLIPYRGDRGIRTANFTWVQRRWRSHFPEFEYIISNPPSNPFNRAAARNRAFEACSGDVVIFADADTTYADPAGIERAIELASQGQWIIAYGPKHYCNLTEACTRDIMAGNPATPRIIPRFWLELEHELESWAGLLVMPRGAFIAVGGYDESFRGWGWEDNAFRHAMDTLWGPFVRVSTNYALHLWHPPSAGSHFTNPDLEYNRSRYRLYEQMIGNPDGMRSIKKDFLSG